jgi:hypothetical protein
VDATGSGSKEEGAIRREENYWTSSMDAKFYNPVL